MATRARRVRQPSRKTARVKFTKSSGNVFADLGFDREEAEHLRIRSDLMATLSQAIKDRGLTQTQAAALFGVSQPRVSDLVRGKIELFTIDTLVSMLARIGIRVEVRATVVPA
jgi:predicted XRE-type DNA-binding protein